MLSALAVTGLFNFAACDDEEETPAGVCDASVDPCKARTDGKTICNVVNGKAVCAIRLGCDGDQVMGEDGLCMAPEPSGTPCDAQGQCAEEGYTCVEGFCQVAPASFKFVMIEDLSTACSEAKTCTTEDPGADIDAVVLKKGGSNDNLKYAAAVRGYKRSDGKQATTSDNEMATNPEKATGKPDSFVAYPTADGICYYYSKDVSSSDEANRIRTYVSLGGKGGQLILEMEDAIEAGDIIDVLELGKCNLYNTKSAPDAKDKDVAKSEPIQIQVAVTDDASSNLWNIVGTDEASDKNKGILSFNILGSHLTKK